MSWRLFLQVFLLSHTAVSLAIPAMAFPVGKSDFQFDDGHGHKLKVLVYQPAGFDAQSPVQFVMHGMTRNAEAARSDWIALADREKALIVAPHFDEAQFKRTDDYTLGPVKNGKRSLDSLAVVEKLFDRIKDDTGSKRDRYRIFGHSAGAQYVHRLVLLVPGNRSEWAVAANAGRYTWPEWRQEKGGGAMAFSLPNGMVALDDARDKVLAALARNVVILLGTADNDPNHHQLAHGTEIDQQGPERLSRGRNFFQAASALATEHKVKFGWTLTLVPGVGHDHRAMAAAAMELMYSKAKKS